MRDIWQTTNIKSRSRTGFATFPKKLKSSGIRRLLERALWEEGIRRPLAPGVKRHEWKVAHGFRKFYKTHAEAAGVKSIYVEYTMGHDIGVSQSYLKPPVTQVLDEYLKAVDALTVNGNMVLLQKQVKELKDESKNNEYIIEGKLREREKTIEHLAENDKLKDDVIASLSDRLMKVEAQQAKRQQ